MSRIQIQPKRRLKMKTQWVNQITKVSRILEIYLDDFDIGNKLCLDELPEERLKNLVVCGSGNTKNVFCGICNKVFVRKISAFDHIVSVHTKKRDHKCFFCDEMLPTINLRNIHMSTKHPEEYRAKKLLDL